MTGTLQRELERALATLKQKRTECLAYTSEIEQLKRDLSATSSQLVQLKEKPTTGNTDLIEINRLKGLIEELQREKIDLTNEIIDRNNRLDAMLEQEEQFQNMRNQLEMEVYAKQEHINECEGLISELQAKSVENLATVGQSQALGKRINELEAQVVELKLKVTNREHEVQKTREMYIEVCREKNDLEEAVKAQFEVEFAARVKARVDAEVGVRVVEWDEEKERLLADEERRVKEMEERLVKATVEMERCLAEKEMIEKNVKSVQDMMQERCLELDKVIKQVRLYLYYLKPLLCRNIL